MVAQKKSLATQRRGYVPLARVLCVREQSQNDLKNKDENDKTQNNNTNAPRHISRTNEVYWTREKMRPLADDRLGKISRRLR